MASTPKFLDRVKESSVTNGTAALTLAGAVTGFQAWSVLGDGNSAYYTIQAVDANGNPSGAWEVGIGTYTLAGTLLSRDTVLASSNGGALVNFGPGTKYVWIDFPAAVALLVIPTVKIVTANYPVVAGDGMILVNSSGAVTVTLPATSTRKGQPVTVKNIGTGTTTIVRTGADLIDGATSQTIAQQYAALGFQSDGVNWYLF